MTITRERVREIAAKGEAVMMTILRLLLAASIGFLLPYPLYSLKWWITILLIAAFGAICFHEGLEHGDR